MLITLPSYGVGGSEFSVLVAKINHLHPIEYNGRSGTCIVMDNGIELTTDASFYEVQKRIAEAAQITKER